MKIINLFRRSELTPEELSDLEIRLRSHGYHESRDTNDKHLQPRQYCKRSSTGAMDDFFNGTWWTVHWRTQ